ncbi:hypothetical protein [uncultured Caulobacter sp.]|uniref:hypothetical protein n=1 Tax=uncultured Caulobacter sp. TaxID=158749 RepID=UPI00260C4010|nr:hypothetical protein [uncultured Caulobacter sp.]
MKNKIIDMNNHLFAQLERLSDEDLTSEQIEREIKRTEAIVDVAKQIVSAADLTLKAASLVAEYGEIVRPSLPMIGGGRDAG